MEKLLKILGSIPAKDSALLMDVLIALLIVLIAVRIALFLQKKFIDWQLDGLITLPNPDKKASSEQPAFFSMLLSWMLAVIFCFLALDTFFPKLDFFKGNEYGDYFLQGWLLLLCYIAALMFIRKFVQALQDFLATPAIGKILQHHFVKEEQKAVTDWDEAFTSMIRFTGVSVYSLFALLTAVLLLMEALKLKVLGNFLNLLLGLFVVFFAIKTARFLQHRLSQWNLDQRLKMPRGDDSGEPSVFFATLLSWATALVLCLIAFEIFLPDIAFLKKYQYSSFLIRGWILLGCYAGILILIRTGCQAIINFLLSASVQNVLKRLFASKENGSNWDETTLDHANSIGIMLYALAATVIGILFMVDVLQLEILGAVISAFLYGLGQLLIAIIMIAVGFLCFRKIRNHGDDDTGNLNKYFAIMAFAGCLLLAIAILMNNINSLFAPLLWLILLLGILLIFSNSLHASMPDILAGLYLRVAGYQGARLKVKGTEHEERLLNIGLSSSTVGVSLLDKVRVIPNRTLLETGLDRKQDVAENQADPTYESRAEK